MRTLPLLTIVLATLAAAAGCQSDATPLEVQPDPLPLTVAPSIVTIDGGRAIKLTATVRQKDGSLSTPSEVRWQSANADIATVAPNGIVEGVRAGRVQIVATWRDSRGSSVVTVLDGVSQEQPCLEALKAGTGSGIPPQPPCQ